MVLVFMVLKIMVDLYFLDNNDHKAIDDHDDDGDADGVDDKAMLMLVLR